MQETRLSCQAQNEEGNLWNLGSSGIISVEATCIKKPFLRGSVVKMVEIQWKTFRTQLLGRHEFQRNGGFARHKTGHAVFARLPPLKKGIAATNLTQISTRKFKWFTGSMLPKSMANSYFPLGFEFGWLPWFPATANGSGFGIRDMNPSVHPVSASSRPARGFWKLGPSANSLPDSPR